MEQLRSEHDARVADLKSVLSMIEKLMEFENGNVVPLENPSARAPSLADRIKGGRLTSALIEGLALLESSPNIGALRS